MSDGNEQTTLRDTLTAAFDAAEVDAAPAVEQPAEQPAETQAQEAAPAEDKIGRTAGRPRDEKGRLLPGKADRTPPPDAQPAAATPAPVEPKAAKARPSTWKKELEPHWGTLAPEVQDEILRREGDFAKGVSTYKQEWDRARPLLEAIAPYAPTLQRFNIAPEQMVQRLFGAHERLSLGSPQDKLAMFAQLARDYQVPIEQLLVQQDGQMQLNPNLRAPVQQPPQVDVQAEVRKAILQERSLSAVQEFEQARDSQGNPRYPHYQQVRDTMAGLLQAGLAADLPSAYEAALRHPQHSDIWEAMQQQQREAEETRKREEAKRIADHARRQNVSPRSQPLTGALPGAEAKGRREALAAAFDAVATGRV